MTVARHSPMTGSCWSILSLVTGTGGAVKFQYLQRVPEELQLQYKGIELGRSAAYRASEWPFFSA